MQLGGCWTNIAGDHAGDVVSCVHVDGDEGSDDVPRQLGQLAPYQLGQLVQVLREEHDRLMSQQAHMCILQR